MKFPDYPQDGKPIEDTVIQMLNWMRANNVVGIEGGAVQESPNGKTIRPKKERKQARGFSAPNPFDVSLKVGGTAEAPTYSVQVKDGWVNERIPGVNDPVTNATAVHEPHNILWGADGASQSPVKEATDRRDFAITVGQQVSILVFVSAEGAIELPAGNTDPGPVSITIEDEDFDSIHYVPPRPVDGDLGIAGEYHYKLAVLNAADAEHSGPWLEIFLAGSHLDHFRDLPILDNCAPASSKIGRPFFKYKKDTNTYLFRNLDANNGQLNIEETDTEESGVVAIRGNGKDGSLTYTPYGETPVTVLEWEDGLVFPTDGVKDIPFPEIPAAPTGWWGACLFEHFALAGDTTPEWQLEQTFEGGILKGVKVMVSGGTLDVVTGTEGSPGFANFGSNGGLV